MTVPVEVRGLALAKMPLDQLAALAGQLGEDADWAAEAYSELHAEYRGEIARYGDAWPGSAHEVAACDDALRRAELAAAAACLALDLRRSQSPPGPRQLGPGPRLAPVEEPF